MLAAAPGVCPSAPATKSSASSAATPRPRADRRGGAPEPDLARCLIIGCGCRGLSLAQELRSRGHAVRGTTRDPSRKEEIRAAGVEPFVGDPDRVATLARALEHVGVACLLLGSATGTAEQLAALHGTRLEMLLERMLDTTVRGVVYECSGSVTDAVLAGGAERVRHACQRSLIPFVLLDGDRSDHGRWSLEAADAVQTALLDRGSAAGAPR
jgi:threonine dehydrogenase-like Zn-dependent dehydrogenase